MKFELKFLEFGSDGWTGPAVCILAEAPLFRAFKWVFKETSLFDKLSANIANDASIFDRQQFFSLFLHQLFSLAKV